MYFKAVELSDMEQIRKWRNEQMSMLRTSYMLTKEMQEQFFKEVICNRNTNSRFWGVWVDDKIGNTFVGMAGLENIQWENRIAEISIITNPEKFHFIPNILEELMKVAFAELNLIVIHTEVYECSPYTNLWSNIALAHRASRSHLPIRKYWDGKYHNSRLYTFMRLEVLHDEDIISESTCTLN